MRPTEQQAQRRLPSVLGPGALAIATERGEDGCTRRGIVVGLLHRLRSGGRPGNADRRPQRDGRNRHSCPVELVGANDGDNLTTKSRGETTVRVGMSLQPTSIVEVSDARCPDP